MTFEKQLLAEIIDVVGIYATTDGEIKPDSHLIDDLGLDSMALVGVLLQLETQLGLRLDAGDISFDQLRTPETLATTLAKKAG